MLLDVHVVINAMIHVKVKLVPIGAVSACTSCVYIKIGLANSTRGLLVIHISNLSYLINILRFKLFSSLLLL